MPLVRCQKVVLMFLPKSTGIMAVFAIAAGIAIGVTISTRELWLTLVVGKSATVSTTGHDDHTGHDHGAGGADDSNRVELSAQARANLGLKTGAVELGDYTRNLVIPGVVAEQPGHSERRITTLLAGVVSRVHAFPGQMVKPGDPLLDLHPTGEHLTNAQADLLKTVQELEVVDLELKRLSPLVENGSIPARNRLEKEYERKRLESQKLVQIQELLVGGLNPQQITEMVEHKKLLHEVTIYVPGALPKFPPKTDDHEHAPIVPAALEKTPETLASSTADRVFTVERIDIFPGKLVQPGEELCDLALHTELDIEGHAFERDNRVLMTAAQQQWPLVALFETADEQPELRENLVIRYVANSLDPATRTQRFYITLKNEVAHDSTADNGVVYRSWRFKPGQKVRVLLPVQRLSGQIVVPAEAVVTEGADSYVFRMNGKLMERLAVTVEHRDPRRVVVRNDGSVDLGDVIALNQAYQINLALKKQQGSGVDMHAGHSH